MRANDVTLISRPEWFFHLAVHLGFVHTFFWEAFSSINGVNWTIAIEMQFYLLIAILTPILVRAPALVVIIVGTSIAWAWRW